MSDMSSERPAGWYHAEGDPPGTQRYWDGAGWQGGPQAIPGSGASEFAGMGAPADYKGYFPTLFDFSLSSFMTPKVIRILYIVGVVLTLLGGVGYLLVFLSAGGPAILFGLILVPIFTLLYLTMIRISTEFVIIAFRTHEEVKQLRSEIGR